MEITFQALTDPHRRSIVQLLRVRPRPVGELVDHLPIAQSGVSRHLRVLREAGLVRSQTEGQRRIYSLCPAPFEELADWLEPYRQLWEDRLDSFEDELARRMSAQPIPEQEDP